MTAAHRRTSPPRAGGPPIGAMLDGLDTEGRDGSRADLDIRDTLGLVLAMNDEDASVAAAVRRAAPEIARLADAVAAGLAGTGRLIYAGAGTAGRVGQQDAAELPPTFGIDAHRAMAVIAGGAAAASEAREDVEDDVSAGAAIASDLDIGPTDVLIGIAASGRTPYTIAAVRAAHARGATTGAVVCNRGSQLAAAADIAVEVVVGPEFVSGSTRLKAGTAQKLVLNTISTVAMIKAGKTYGDLMVDVRPTNEKLRVRARRIVAQAAGTDDAAANLALTAADGNIRAAVIHLVAGLPVEQAALVSARFASLREALAAAEGAPDAPV
ncbi:MAG: N-acetylmuramic acid 6-phosphate etherase [Mycobacteriales bacterium]